MESKKLDLKPFSLAVVIGGLAQLVLGIARAGIVGKYFPGSVIQGMLAAIGIIIFIKQIPHGLGYAGAEGTAKADKVFDVLLLLGDNLAYAAPTAIDCDWGMPRHFALVGDLLHESPKLHQGVVRLARGCLGWRGGQPGHPRWLEVH